MTRGNFTNHPARKRCVSAGDEFGKWKVIEQPAQGTRHCLCECKCGTVKMVDSSSLSQGKASGCNKCKYDGKEWPTDAKSLTPEYRVWSSMKARCLYPCVNGYKNYGGRGISVCERWANSFDNFIADMGKRPSDGHSIDRIDVNGNYEPSNCRWATDQEQRRNIRKKPPKPCVNCGKIVKTRWYGERHACNEYKRRNGRTRPCELYTRRSRSLSGQVESATSAEGNAMQEKGITYSLAEQGKLT